MNKKKIFAIIFILIIIGAIIYSIIKHNNTIIENNQEDYFNYTPQEEISDEQLRETTITLYFLNLETNQLKSEGKLIDANELLKNPYKAIIQNLIDGPKDSTLQAVFPENTRIIDASITKNCVILNFSEELLNYTDDTQKYNIINSILNSLSQLNEVNSIKFLINNETIENMDEEYSVIY